MVLHKSRKLQQIVLALIAFIAVACVYFSQDALQGQVLRQHDVLQGAAIGHEAQQYKERTGKITRWTDALFGGMPTFQISPTYESTAWFAWIGKVLGFGLPSPANIFVIMMLGFFVLLLAFDCRWDLAILGAIAWGFSTYFFILIGAGHIWKYVTLSYIPPTLAGIVWAYRGRYLLGGVVAALSATMQLCSNHVQMTYYFAFVIVALFIGFLIKAIRHHQMRQFGIATAVLAIAGILALLANMPNLYNTYKYSKETMRGGQSELVTASSSDNATKGGLDKDYITAWSYGIDETLTLIVPNAKGGASIKPQAGESIPLSLSQSDEAQKMYLKGEIDSDTMNYMSQFLQYFGEQPMTNGPVYVGVVIFALFLLGCIIVKGSLKWCLLAVLVLTIGLSWGHNMMWLTDLFIDYFPMYNKFRTVASILVVAELIIPLMAVLALKTLLESDNPAKQYAKAIYVSFGVTALLCLMMFIMPQAFGDGITSDEQYQMSEYLSNPQAAPFIRQLLSTVANVRFAMVSSDALRSLILTIIGFAIIFAYIKKPKMLGKYLGAALIILTLIDLAPVNKRYLDRSSFASKYAQNSTGEMFTPREADRQILQDKSLNYRVLDLDKFMEAMPSYYHKTIGGYHAAKLSRYQDLLDQQFSRGINMEVVNMLNGKYIIQNNQVIQNPDALGNAWFVDTLTYVKGANAEMHTLSSLHTATSAVADEQFRPALGSIGSAKQAGDTIIETAYEPNHLTYTANSANGGVAVFSEVYFPWGWDATIDGKPAQIGRVNYILRALRLPAGKHIVEFRFEPSSVSTTETFAYIAIALMYLGVAVLIVRSIIRLRQRVQSEGKDGKMILRNKQ